MTGWVGLDRLMTARDVADVLAAPSTRTVDRLRRAGAIPAVRIGRGYRFHPEDVQAYLDKVRAEGAA